jgi:S-adenosyl-L-methionine hydrolase (adenosine-forming)
VKRRDIVTFLSDYGLQDEFVGVCHGVMLSVAPFLKIVDINHQILRQDIRHGAVVLLQAIRYMPDAVHLAVVDPSVGSDRRAVVIESGWGETFVGPDNGLLLPAAQARGGIKRAFEIVDQRFLLTPVSRTFQGRDVFAPVAAHIASGVDPAELGPAVAADDLVPLEISHAWVHDDHLHAEVLQVDRFGNLQFNFDRPTMETAGIADFPAVEVRMEGHRLKVPYEPTFAAVPEGAFVLVEDSYRYMSLAINTGDAAARLRARAGSTAIIGPPNG